MATAIDGHQAIAQRQTENVDRLTALVDRLVERT